MGQLFAAALPILPGQSDRVRNFTKECQELRDEYDELNRKATQSRHVIFLQPGPMGDTAIHIMEGNDLSKIQRDFVDSAHDKWWLGFLKDVHGIDLLNMSDPPQPPEMVFDSSAGRAP
ncbi:MAG: hypothetical protein ACR2FO_03280 [Actinomycetota bacterium]